MLKPKDELVTVTINDYTFRIAKDRYEKLSKKHREVIKLYDKDNVSKGNSERTRDNQIHLLIQFAIQTGKEFDNITKQNINDWLRPYKEKYATFERYKIELKKFFRWLEKPELVEQLKAKIVPEKLTSDDMWTEEEVLALITACDETTLEGKRDQCIVAMMYDLMLERSAVVNLNIDDIKDNGDSMKVKVTGKRRGNVKTVVLEPIMSVYYIREWLKVHPQRNNKSRPLFISFSVSNEGQRLSETHPWWLLKRLRKRSGIEKPIYPHLLRHSKATDLYQKGFRGIPLQRTLRHSSIQMQERYAHLCDEDVNNERVKVETGIDRKANRKTNRVLMTIACPKCNEVNPPSNTYCGKCSYPLNPQVDTLEQMVTKFLKSLLYQDEKQISKEANEFMDVEVLAKKFNQLLADQQVKGRKQVKVIPQ